MGRDKRKRGIAVTGAWLPMPLAFLRSRSCAELSTHGAKLLIDILARLGPNAARNGDISLAPQCMRERGWTSRATLSSAVKELERYGLIVKTKQGSRLDCNLFALTLFPMDCDFNKLDVGPGCYTSREWEQAGLEAPSKEKPATWRHARKTVSDVPPRNGVSPKRYATEQSPKKTKPEKGTSYRHGTKPPDSEHSSVPPRVTYIDKPSASGIQTAPTERAHETLAELWMVLDPNKARLWHIGKNGPAYGVGALMHCAA